MACARSRRFFRKLLALLREGCDPVAFDPHSPGSQGPTYKGRPRVPAGQTFSREPTTGVGLPAPLRTP